jgi:hypothetical protein
MRYSLHTKWKNSCQKLSGKNSKRLLRQKNDNYFKLLRRHGPSWFHSEIPLSIVLSECFDVKLRKQQQQQQQQHRIQTVIADEGAPLLII